MELVYTGKTKNVYALENGNILLKFKDDMTGVNGVFDPGANEIGLTVEGMGKTNLKVTTKFFELLKDYAIPTHFVSANLEDGTMEVKKCQPFGKGAEIIFRNLATGSFVRRYGLYVEEMTPLHDYVEVTLKDDGRLDPLITKEGLMALNLLSEEEYDTIVSLTIQIAKIVTDYFAKKDAQLVDIKFEYGRDENGNIVLIDEISAGNMRVYQNGEFIGPDAISYLALGE